MNSNHLAQYYDRLTPWERLPLLTAAWARGDTCEGERLTRSAPMHCFRLPHHWGLIEGLYDLAMLYLLQQLDWALTLEQAMAQMELGPSLRPGKAARREKRLWKAIQALACRFVLNIDGWNLLCAEWPIDLNVMLQKLPGYDSVQRMEKRARLIAGTAVPGAGDLETAAEVARSMRDFLETRQAEWS